MEANRLRSLRRKQILYTNILFLIYMLVMGGLIFFQASAMIVYLVLGLIFLISPISLQLTKRPNPLLFLFPGMKELYQYESKRLGESWRKYYTSSIILQIILSVFFFVQAFMRDGSDPFIEGIPLWYLIAIPLILLWIGNMNLIFHARRIDQKTDEQLKAYAYEKMLFSVVFTCVALVMIILGTIVVLVMTNLKLT